MWVWVGWESWRAPVAPWGKCGMRAEVVCEMCELSELVPAADQVKCFECVISQLSHLLLKTVDTDNFYVVLRSDTAPKSHLLPRILSPSPANAPVSVSNIVVTLTQLRIINEAQTH